MNIEQTSLLDRLQNNNAIADTTKGIENYVPEETKRNAFEKKESYELGKVGSSAVVSMADSTYKNPCHEEEKTVAQSLEENLEKTSENRKNEMAVLASTTTPEDYQKLEESGFSVTESDSHTIVTVMDKIKAVYAKAGIDISIYGDTLSVDQLEEITGSKTVATSISNMTKDAMSFLIKNQLPPTVGNVYMANHVGTGSVYGSTQTISSEAFEEMKGKISEFLTEAGIEVTEESLSDCQWLMEQGIEITHENLTYLQDLEAFASKLTESGNAVYLTKQNTDTLLIGGYSKEDEADRAFEVIQNATEEDLAYLIFSEKDLTISNLQIAKNVRENKQNSIDLKNVDEGSLIRAKRVLEETRLIMTTEANLSFLKKGFSIDTKPLEELVEELKVQEQSYFKEVLQSADIDKTQENVKIFQETTAMVSEMKFHPAYALTINSGEETIPAIYDRSAQMKATFEMAEERYETMWTAPRQDMGDSIQKAFQNVDEILEDLGLEVTSANQRAVRILGYNQIEITSENIAKIKAADEMVQQTFTNLTPKVTLEMIRRNINPLEMTMSEINQAAKDIQSDLGYEDTERFQKYLWKLEQHHEISEEERKSYIGIYRLIAQVDKLDGAAIGALWQQGADITMKNLLSAVRTERKGSMTYQVDDTFEGISGTIKGEKIDDQIMAAYTQNVVKDVLRGLTPEQVKHFPKNWEEMTPEQLKEYINKQDADDTSVAQSQDAGYVKEQIQMLKQAFSCSEEAYAFLERYDISNSAANILAASEMLRNPNKMFQTLLKERMDKRTNQELVSDIKDEIMERFGEAIKTPEELADAQETLAEVATKVMQGMIMEEENISAIDLKELRMMNNQFWLCKEAAKEENFVIPVSDGDSVTGISLKIVRGKEDKGFVDIMFRGQLMEKVAASFEAKDSGISGMIAVSDEETRQLLSDNLGMFVSKLQEGDAEPIDIRIARIPDLDLSHFAKTMHQKESEEEQKQNVVQTKRLYHIAESFISTVQELMD